MTQAIALLQVVQGTPQLAPGLKKFRVSGLECTSSSPHLDNLLLTPELWDLQQTGQSVSARLR